MSDWCTSDLVTTSKSCAPTLPSLRMVSVYASIFFGRCPSLTSRWIRFSRGLVPAGSPTRNSNTSCMTNWRTFRAPVSAISGYWSEIVTVRRKFSRISAERLGMRSIRSSKSWNELSIEPARPDESSDDGLRRILGSRFGFGGGGGGILNVWPCAGGAGLPAVPPAETRRRQTGQTTP